MSLKLAMQRRAGLVPPSLPLSLCLAEMGWGVGAAAVHRSRTLPMPPIVAPVRPQPVLDQWLLSGLCLTTCGSSKGPQTAHGCGDKNSFQQRSEQR